MRAFAAGVRTLFRDPNLGVDGVYTPLGGVPVPVRLLRLTGTDRIAGGLAQYGGQAEHDTAELQVADVPVRPGRGALVTYEGKVRRVATVAAPARNGLTWLLELESG